MLNRITSTYLGCTLLFLFPLFGNLIRSWTGVIFVLMLLLALTIRPWRQVDISANETNIIFALVIIFTTTVLSGLLNGWSDNQTRGLGIYIRFLAGVPVLFLLLYINYVRMAFSLGCVAAAFILAIQSLFEIFVVGNTRVMGVYESPGLVAGQAMVFCIVSSLLALNVGLRRALRALGLIGIISSLIVLFLSGSRASYLSFLMTSLTVITLLAPKHIRRSLFVAYTFGLTVLSVTVPYFSDRVTSGFYELIAYLENSDDFGVQIGSVGQRLEMWKGALHLFIDRPAFGGGWRSFSENTELLVEQGLIHPLAAGHPHPHSTYLEFLTSGGILGLFSLLIWIYFSFLNLRSSSADTLTKKCAMSFFLLILFMGINEGGLFIYGNSLSFYLIVFGFFMTLCRSEVK